MADPDDLNLTRQAGIDKDLLARMIGRAGDPRTIRAKAAELAGAVCGPLEAALLDAAGLAASVSCEDVELGVRSALEAKVAETDVRCPAAIRDWCHHFSMSTSTAMAVAFAESLLGGSDGKGEQRPLSPVELDVSIMLFEQFLDVLKRVADAGEAVATTGAPTASAPDHDDDDLPDVHSVMMTFRVTFGDTEEPLRLLLPQQTMLKTRIVLPEPESTTARQVPPEWAERLKRQVARSDVTLRAQIRLLPMTLGDLARLSPGDVLPFADEHDVEVRLDANGRDLARCELGRSGSRYMLRLKPEVSLEAELMRDMP